MSWPSEDLSDLGPRWWSPSDSEADLLLIELHAKIPADHVLADEATQVVAVRMLMKDLVLWLPELRLWAWVHQTYKQETDPRFPSCGLYANWQDLLANSL